MNVYELRANGRRRVKKKKKNSFYPGCIERKL
jgi:hypothetical protein